MNLHNLYETNYKIPSNQYQVFILVFIQEKQNYFSTVQRQDINNLWNKSFINFMQKEKPYFLVVVQNPLIFDQVCEFLAIHEILNLSAVSKSFKAIIEHACRHKISDLNLKIITNKSSIHQMQFYFNRCLRVQKAEFDPEKPQQQPVYHDSFYYHPFKEQIITLFEVGPIYTSYLTIDHKAKLFRTRDFILKEEEEKQANINVYEKFSNIRDLRCKAQQAILTRSTGQVSLLHTLKNSPQVILDQKVLEWTLRIPIKKVQTSFNYCIFFPENQTTRQKYFQQILNIAIDDQHKNMVYAEEKNTIILAVRNMLNGKYIFISLPCEQIIECTVGNKVAYFINEKNEVFSVDFDPNSEQNYYEVKGKLYEPFIGKNIIKISSGFNFFIALERQIDNLEDWDNERVLQWLRDIGLKDFMKIAKVEQLDGKKLKNIQRKYMYNALGITKQNMQQKFLMSIEENLKKKSKNDTLYGWGKNQFGQLGSSAANYIAKPQKIRLTCLNAGEYIDSVTCGWFQTFIRTQKGRIYTTARNIEKKKKKEQKEEQKIMMMVEYSSSEEQDDFRREKLKKKSSKNVPKKKKKPTQPHQQKQKNPKKIEQNWLECKVGKAFNVQTYKNTIFFVQCPAQEKEDSGKSKKMRTAKTILDKILWSSMNKEDFRVGYMDKDMGLIQASAYEMEMFDVKQNRIKYFKKKDLIIWDREQKIDLL